MRILDQVTGTSTSRRIARKALASILARHRLARGTSRKKGAAGRRQSTKQPQSGTRTNSEAGRRSREKIATLGNRRSGDVAPSRRNSPASVASAANQAAR